MFMIMRTSSNAYHMFHGINITQELAKWKWDFYLLCKDEFRARNSSYS